jgi:two-component system, cell cycle sensor histidine kinase and response regulator CckA
MHEVTSDRGILDEKLCSTLINSIHGIVWEADPLTFRFSFVSPHAERILGYPMQQWVDEPDFWRTHTHPDDVEWCSDYCREASLKGEDHEFQYRMIAADGRIVWLHDIVTVVRLDDGGVRLRGIMFDITERKKADDALRASEERLRVMFDTSHSGIIMIDPDGNISFANKRMAEMFSCTLPELIGSPYLDRLHPEELQTNINLLEQLMNKEIDNGATERHYLRCDGSDFWGYVTSTQLKLACGEPKALVAVVTDITDSKTQQLAMMEETARWQMLMERSRDGIVIIDAGSIAVSDANPAFAEMLGYSREELLGMHPWDWDLRFTREEIEAMPVGDDIFFETKMRCRDGTVLNVEVSSTLTEFREKRQSFCICRDITEHKLAEEELKGATQRLQLAVSSGHLGIWDWDIVNDVLVWNERMYELYGVSKDTFKISRETWEKCLHPDDLALALEETRAAFSGEKEYDFEFRILRPDGETKFIKTNGKVIRDEAGNPIRLIGMNQDITDRRHLQEQLRQAQKMEAIGQLAGGVAHDFNNILTAIYGHCSVLQMKMGNDAPFRSDIDHIYAAAEKAANLTRSLLAFSRKQIMSPKNVNLNELVMNVAKLLTRIIGEDIQLKAVCKGVPLRVFADSGQIEQVLMNLATNARDAMTNGGTLTIETGVQEIDESFIHAYGYGDVGKYVVLSISDTGKGMDAETSKKIFEPFFTTKEVGKGTGLGLSIVYGVIKQHNGYINVYSEPDEGTTFRIYLPQVHDEDADKEKEAPLEYPRMGSETVLVAEDDATIRELAGAFLRQYGYDVILAHDGEDAVEKFMASKEKIAIIVMDMIMPRKGGNEAYEEIRKVRSDVKILFMSGYSPDLLHDRGVFANGEEVLIKPIHPLELVRKVRAILDLSP